MPDFLESLSKMLEIEVASYAFAIVLAATLIAGIIDVRSCYIPNWLTLGLIVSALLFHLVLPIGRGWLFSLSGLCFGLAVLLPFFVLGGVGAADVKLLAGIGAWVGIHDVVAIFLVFGTLMGLYAMLLMVFKGEGRHLVKRILDRTSSAERIEEAVAQAPAERHRRVMPMAPAMALAILILAVAR